jgi:ATP-dependent RNA helicase RhlE
LGAWHVVVKSPTGWGNALAFGIPVAERLNVSCTMPSAPALAPTRELAHQILEEPDDIVAAKCLRAAAVYGGVGLTAQARRAAKAHLLVAMPGRLEDLLARGAFTLDPIGSSCSTRATGCSTWVFAP